MQPAMTMSPPEGITAAAWFSLANSPAIAMVNTPMARAMPKKMMSRNRILARGPMTPSATLPTDCPRARIDTTRAEKSWTHPTRTAPRTTHSIAGPHPQMTATAGPSIGASPVIEAQWCPNST